MIIAELIPGGHIQDLLRWHWDGDTVVQVPGSRHFRVDDQGRVPRVATTLGPDKVERFKGDATRGRRGRRVVVVRGAVVVVAVVARIVVVVFGGGDDVGGRSRLSVVVGLAGNFSSASVDLKKHQVNI